MKRLFAIGLLLAAFAANAQSGPQAVLDGLIGREIEINKLATDNQLMRLEQENADLARARPYRLASDRQITRAIRYFCPMGVACRSDTPPALIEEAARRGYANVSGGLGPRTQCYAMGDGFGGGTLTCY